MAHQIQEVDAEPEETYDENADEDFDPHADDDGADNGSSTSSDDEDGEETTAATPKKQAKSKATKKRTAKQASLDNDLDSGDEATINAHKAKKQKRRRKQGKDAPEAADDDDSAGEGGLIKTRAQRLAEKVERKQRKYITQGDVTIDVDAVWAELNGLGVGRSSRRLDNPGKDPEDGDGMQIDEEGNKENHSGPHDTAQAGGDDEMITITRLVEYAGETSTITERVPRSSKAAQQYLVSNPSGPTPNPDPAVLRPLKRPSLFEPNPTGLVKGVPPTQVRPRAPSRLDVLQAEKRAAEEAKKKAERMTTVQKSALDWRGFVDQEEGLKGELEKYGKSGRGYLEREGFLGRVELAREGARRDARLKG